MLSSFAREASIAVTRGVVESGLPAGPVRIAPGPVEIVAGVIAERRSPTDSAPATALVTATEPTRPDDQRNGEITT